MTVIAMTREMGSCGKDVAIELAERLEVTRESARKEIVINDRAHDRLLRRLVRADWRDPLRYDLILNTARIGIPQGAAMIEQLSRSPAFRRTPASTARLRRLRIEAQIRSGLREDRAANDDVAAINVEVDPETRHVVLSGGIRRRATREAVLGIVGGVPDVARVDDRIELVRD